MSEKHVHKFKRYTYKSTGNAVYFCALPDCNFKIGTEFALGKMCICWRCNQPFQMTQYSLRLAQPHCSNCHNNKKSDKRKRSTDNDVIVDVAQSTLNDLSSRMNSVTNVGIEDDEEL